jgi:hypothetical protein
LLRETTQKQALPLEDDSWIPDTQAVTNESSNIFEHGGYCGYIDHETSKGVSWQGPG